ncbi:MAG: hypothetical protein IMX00_05040 [Limnochordales bacterium]|nr:hypothetical protein [Limnochordales bacterium]
MGKVIWGLNAAMARLRTAWERRIRTGEFISRLRAFALTPEDLVWLPRLVNLRLLIVSDQVLLNSRARQPALILLPSGAIRVAAMDGPAQSFAETFYKLLLLSVRALPLAPEACLLQHPRRWWAAGRQKECGCDRGVSIARTGAVLTPRNAGLMVTDHALLNRTAAGGRRTAFSLLRGTPDVVLAQCRWIWRPGEEGGSQVRLLSEEEKGEILAAADQLMAQSYLPVSLAIRYQVGQSLGTGCPPGEDPGSEGEIRAIAGRGGRGKAAVYLGLMAFDNPLYTGVEKILDFFRSRGVNVLWESRLPSRLQRAIAASALDNLVMTGEQPSRLPGSVRHLAYVGRERTEEALVCREWEVARVQAFPDGSGRLQSLGHLPRRVVPVPAPASEGSLLVRLQELYLLAEQAIIAGVQSN